MDCQKLNIFSEKIDNYWTLVPHVSHILCFNDYLFTVIFRDKFIHSIQPTKQKINKMFAVNVIINQFMN